VIENYSPLSIKKPLRMSENHVDCRVSQLAEEPHSHSNIISKQNKHRFRLESALTYEHNTQNLLALCRGYVTRIIILNESSHAFHKKDVTPSKPLFWKRSWTPVCGENTTMWLIVSKPISHLVASLWLWNVVA